MAFFLTENTLQKNTRELHVSKKSKLAITRFSIFLSSPAQADYDVCLCCFTGQNCNHFVGGASVSTIHRDVARRNTDVV